MICMTMLPPMSTGMSSRLMMKALVRTAARYSRTAITHTLRTMVLLRLGAGDAHENVVQGRPGQLEVPDRSAIHQGRQDGLRIRAALEAHFLPAAEVGDLCHARHSLPTEPVSFYSYAERVAAVRLLNRLQGAVQDLTALVDHENEIAHVLRYAPVVG